MVYVGDYDGIHISSWFEKQILMLSDAWKVIKIGIKLPSIFAFTIARAFCGAYGGLGAQFDVPLTSSMGGPGSKKRLFVWLEMGLCVSVESESVWNLFGN